ncbi:MAG: cupin domain-containing protein [Phototrophicales bacterium]|nr:MAG: cupin domain-containing protein [Phototrophicales bacterium]
MDAMGVIRRRQPDGEWVWQDTDIYTYNSNNATKQVLVGHDDGAHNFEMRVFTIPPRGFSSLDEHAHDHGVLVLQGKARVMLGDTFDEVCEGDSVYIPSMERHQFENLTDQPFVFLCVIPPKPINK